MRFRDDDWATAEQAAWAAKSDVTTLTTLAMEAMLGYIRCYRCRENAPPVPVIMGDLTGTTLREALADAEKQAVSQHPRHAPVTIATAPPFMEPRRRPARHPRPRSPVTSSKKARS